MTIASSTRKAGPFTGDGASTIFAFSFKVFSASDLYVVKAATATSAETVLTLTTDYTVSLNADQNNSPGGTVLLNSALGVGYTLTLASRISYTQNLTLTNQGAFYPAVINSALDRLTILTQQLNEQVQRCVRLPISSPDGSQVPTAQQMRADVQTTYDNVAEAQSAKTAAETARDQAAQTLANSDLANRIGTSGPAAGRNLADNADFRIWTRGESATVADGRYQYCADRYRIANSNGTGATATVSKSTMLVDGVTRSCGMVTLSAAVGSFTSGKHIAPFVHTFEGRSVYRYLSPGKSFTVGVDIEVSVAGKYAFTVRNADFTYSYVHTVTLASNTPTFVSFAVAIPSTAGIWSCPNTEAAGLDLVIGGIGHSQSAASTTDAWVSGAEFYTSDCVNWAATAGATIKVTRVRLEEGTVLGAYHAKTYDEDSARCQYFLPSIPAGIIGICSWTTATTGLVSYPFKVQARVAPTGISIPPGLTVNIAPFALSSFSYYGTTSNQIGAFLVAGSGATAGSSAVIYTTGSGSIIFTGAEL